MTRSFLTAWCAAAPLLASGLCSAGHPQVVRLNDASFDVFTSQPDSALQGWFRAHLWRMVVFSPYFDARLRWFPGGDLYKNLYSIDPNGPLAAQHPDWILRDSRGDPLYIPWGCSGGACPQYAGDVSNPAFRQWWIADAAQLLARGYRGLFIDDVNLEFRVGDGNGTFGAPADPHTGAPMTYGDWRRYVAEFTEAIRAAFPGREIIHNSIWSAGPSGITDQDPFVRRQIAAADYQYIEHGVSDPGLTGDGGAWSLHALLTHIDRVHAAARGVILGGVPAAGAGAEYAVASYFLIASGSDAIATAAATPNDWWPGFDTDLGVPIGPRAVWNGLLRRDFTGGLALVNPPESLSITVTLPQAFRRVDGATISSVTLGAAQGVVLLSLAPAPLPAGCTPAVLRPVLPARPSR